MNEFIEKIKKESEYKKIISEEAINKLINIYSYNIKKEKYKKTIENPLKIVENFYKNYKKEYYNIIQKGIKDKEIILNSDNTKTDIKKDICYIKLKNDDSDLYKLVHEFAHFIDRKSNPHIILDNHNFLCEVFSFYMEKEFEKYLKGTYSKITEARIQNRKYNLNKFSKIIDYEKELEDLYKTNKLATNNADNNKIDTLKNIKNENIINYYLRYLLGDLLSDYIIKENIIPKKGLSKILLEKDLMEIINNKLN